MAQGAFKQPRRAAFHPPVKAQQADQAADQQSGKPTGRLSTFFQADAGTQQALRPSSNPQSAKPPFSTAAQQDRQVKGVSLASAAAPSANAFGRGLQASTLSDLDELDDLLDLPSGPWGKGLQSERAAHASSRRQQNSTAAPNNAAAPAVPGTAAVQRGFAAARPRTGLSKNLLQASLHKTAAKVGGIGERST